jgi:uncharacterized protein with HEPN domain
VSRSDNQRLQDIYGALDMIDSHLKRGTLDDGMVFDAVCMRLVQIGEVRGGS